MSKNTVNKMITITKEQEEWVQNHHLKISSFVQEKLDELMEERGYEENKN